MQLGFDLSIGEDEEPEKENPIEVMKELCTTCNSCRLSEIHPTNRGMIYRGSLNAKIAVIGIAPGDTETEKGTPMIGASGKLFEEWMKYISVDTRNDTFITNIIQCFPGDAEIEASEIQKVFRRYYSGPAVRITTQDNVLTGTPNHPVLTSRGWVPLCELHEGDYLVRCHSVREEPSVSPDEHHRPASFKEVFSSCSEDGVLEGIIGSSGDFHGDGTNSNIDIVRPNRFLRNHFESTIAQKISELSLVLADDRSSPEPTFRSGNSSFHQSSTKLGLTPSRVVSISSQLTALSPRGFRVSQLVPFLEPSDSDSILPEAVKDGSVFHPSLTSELLETLPGQVTLSQVVKVELIELAEHVYNLETASHLYVTQGFVVANCQPPKKKINGRLKQRDPERDEIAACFGPRCLRVLRAMPNLEAVMVLGWVPAKAFLGTSGGTAEPKTKTHEGQWFESSLLPGVAIFCLSHPAELIYNDSDDKKMTIQHCLDYFKQEYLKGGKVKALAQVAKERREELGLGLY